MTTVMSAAAVITAALGDSWRLVRKWPWMTMALTSWLVVTVGVGVAHADTTTPVGLADLLPRIQVPPGSRPSLFEGVSAAAYTFDVAPTVGLDVTTVQVMNGIANVIWGLAVLVVTAAILLGHWILSLVNVPGLNDLIATGLSATSQQLMSWLGPTALAIGGLVAFAQQQGDRITQAIWVVITAILGFSLALSPGLWITGVQNLRSAGADITLSIGSSAIGSPDQQTPFAWPATDYAGVTPRDTTLRKSADATWRGLVVAPWCIGEFGSMEACAAYAPHMLGKTPSERTKFINERIRPAEGGTDDAPTLRWTRGYDWGQRLLVGILSLLVNLVVCGVLLTLAFAAIGALISTAFHLLLGVAFALCWCIPGRPRAIGMAWLESLIGTIIQGILAVGIYSLVLSLITLLFVNAGALGGTITTYGLVIVALFSALRFRRTVESWFGAVAGPAGAAMLGAVAMRLLSRGVVRIAAPGGRGHRSRPTPGTDRTGQGDRSRPNSGSHRSRWNPLGRPSPTRRPAPTSRAALAPTGEAGVRTTGVGTSTNGLASSTGTAPTTGAVGRPPSTGRVRAATATSGRTSAARRAANERHRHPAGSTSTSNAATRPAGTSSGPTRTTRARPTAPSTPKHNPQTSATTSSPQPTAQPTPKPPRRPHRGFTPARKPTPRPASSRRRRAPKVD